jgi:hypothetical protein
MLSSMPIPAAASDACCPTISPLGTVHYYRLGAWYSTGPRVHDALDALVREAAGRES